MGVFIAIEGGDGSGKKTQAELLVAYLRDSLKKNVLTIAFPQHGQFSSYYADQYLNGRYGGINDVHADLASLPYAFDRFAAAPEIRKVLDDPNGIVIADRYVASNLAHQGSKFSDEKERHEYYERMMKTEYEVLGIPRPDVNIVLLVPSAIAQENIDKKDARNYTELTRDIHEQDSEHLDRSKANYEELTKLFSDEFKAIECTQNGAMRPIDEIQSDIRHRIEDFIK